MPTSPSTSDTLVNEIHIAAPPERVFQALTDPQQVMQWWGQEGIFRCTQFESDLRAGGKWRNAGTSGDGSAFEAHGEYLEVVPPRLLVMTWVASWTGDVQTTVRWELEPAGQGTLVRIRHSGLSARPDLAKSYSGWPRLLGWFEAFIARGETVHSRPVTSRS
jgi:uncharacterized protein YndB with AHSA1/START domain